MLSDCCDSHNAIFYPPRSSATTRRRRAPLFERNTCGMHSCSQKQIDKIPGQISPAITKKQENISISPETNPGVVVGVSMAIGQFLTYLRHI